MRQGSQRTHRGDVDDTAFSLFYHVAAKHLATLKSSHKIQIEHFMCRMGIQVKESALSCCCGMRIITSGGIYQHIHRAKHTPHLCLCLLKRDAVKHVAAYANGLISIRAD